MPVNWWYCIFLKQNYYCCVCLQYMLYSWFLTHDHIFTVLHFCHMQWTAEGSVFGAVSLWFFVCVWNVSGTAEQICAKFTRKTCFVPHSDEFEGQRSRSPGTKTGIFRPLRQPACSLCLDTTLLANMSHWYAPWTWVVCTEHQCPRAMLAKWQCFLLTQPVHTGACLIHATCVHRPSTRPINTGVILNTRERGPSW